MVGNLLAVRKSQVSRATNTSPRSATRCRARCRAPRNSRSCASGNTAPAAATERPSVARSTACKPAPRTRRTWLPKARSASDRKTHAPASAASPPMSPSGHPEQPPIVPSPSLIRPQANNATESEPHDFVNGLLSLDERVGRAAVQHLAAALQQALVSCVLDQCMLETVVGLRRDAVDKQDVRLREPLERRLQSRLAHVRHRLKQHVREATSKH